MLDASGVRRAADCANAAAAQRRREGNVASAHAWRLELTRRRVPDDERASCGAGGLGLLDCGHQSPCGVAIRRAQRARWPRAEPARARAAARVRLVLSRLLRPTVESAARAGRQARDTRRLAPLDDRQVALREQVERCARNVCPSESASGSSCCMTPDGCVDCVQGRSGQCSREGRLATSSHSVRSLTLSVARNVEGITPNVKRLLRPTPHRPRRESGAGAGNRGPAHPAVAPTRKASYRDARRELLQEIA